VPPAPLSHAAFYGNRFNVYVVALAVGFGMILVMAPNFFGQLPHAQQPLLVSGILLAAVVAVILNAFFSGVAGAALAREGIVASAATAVHVARTRAPRYTAKRKSSRRIASSRTWTAMSASSTEIDSAGL
jgi:hypothetical protein